MANRYALLFHEGPEARAQRDDPATRQAYYGAWMAYIGAIQAAGIVQAGSGLLPAETATGLRLQGGQRQVQDGPFADSKEQLGGFLIIEVADLDAALDWAARCPAAVGGMVEVRPTLPPMPG